MQPLPLHKNTILLHNSVAPMVYMIAEIAQAHNGELDLAHSYIQALSETGIDAVKFQVHIAAAESSIHEPFRVQLSSRDKTRFDYWKRMEFSLDQWKELKAHCEEMGVEFLASPFSNAAVDLLEKVGVMRYKIGSGEVNNFLLLEKIARTKKPVILSSGMSSFEELDRTVSFLRQREVEFSILQCTTAYPTSPETYGLNVLEALRKRYEVQVGYSDHSADIGACIAAMALGAEILEFHAVFERNSPGPDAFSSLEIAEIKQLVQSVRKLETAFSSPVDKSDNSKFQDLKNIFEKSLAVNKDLQKGHILRFEDLESKKPKGYGMDASRFEEVVGKETIRSLNQWDFLSEEDLLE